MTVGTRIEVDCFSPKTGEYLLTRPATIVGRYEIGASEEIIHPTSLVDSMERVHSPRRGYLVQFDGYSDSCAFEDAKDFNAVPGGAQSQTKTGVTGPFRVRN